MSVEDRTEGRPKPKRWEQLEEETRWCSVCRTHTEHDPEGCVDCGIREAVAAAEGQPTEAPEEGEQ